MFPNPIMMKRLKRAIRNLFGSPVPAERVLEEMCPEEPYDTKVDFTLGPPADFSMRRILTPGREVQIMEDGRFRVCVIVGKDEETGEYRRWLVLELKTLIGWQHLVTAHEDQLATMLNVLHDAEDYLDGYRVTSENLCRTRDLPRAMCRQDW